ncbi:MAG: amidohydrolase family protein [Myxococcales bacterium]|nr:amidohydrolase family protein [Myxococcales bacterium]
MIEPTVIPEETSSSALELAFEVEETARAIVDLARRSSCCGPRLASEVGAALPARARASKRRRHRVRPTSCRFVLPEVTVVEADVSRTVGDLLVADGRIVDLVPVGTAVSPDFERLPQYRGCFVTAALVDMHGHFPPDNILGLTSRFLLLHLAHGVTTVRDAGDVDGTATPAVRDGLADGRFVGPRVFSSGPFVTRAPARWGNSLFVEGPADAERIALELRRRGMQCMKLYENLRRDEIVALERAAREHGLVTLGHVPTALGFEDAPLADAQHFFGVAPPASLPRDHVLDRNAHWDAVDDARVDVIVRAAVEGQRANTPTVVALARLASAGAEGVLDDAATRLLPQMFRTVVWHPTRGLPAYRSPTPSRADRLQRALAAKLALVGRLHRAGAPLRLGTDVQQPFVVPGAALHEELRLFVRAGVAPAVALRMATRDAALALGRSDLGTTRKSACADLVVWGADPSQDLSALSTMRAVVHEGSLFDHGALARELDEDLAMRDRAFERIASSVLSRLALWRVSRRFVA